MPTGRSLNVLVDQLTQLARGQGVMLQSPWQHILRKAGEIEANDLQVDLAFFAGPLGSRGSISRITTENLTIGHLFHADFRSMADNYASCASWLDETAAWKTDVLSGGLTQTAPVLRTLLQKQFTAPLRESSREETLQGLLQLARECAT